MKFSSIVKNINLAKDNLSDIIKSNDVILVEEDIILLKNYYKDNKKETDRLVLEDEFIGSSYKNLDLINKVVNSSKTPLIKKFVFVDKKVQWCYSYPIR